MTMDQLRMDIATLLFAIPVYSAGFFLTFMWALWSGEWDPEEA